MAIIEGHMVPRHTDVGIGVADTTDVVVAVGGTVKDLINGCA